jgi:membrane protease YdiL (CAAX protease family)
VTTLRVTPLPVTPLRVTPLPLARGRTLAVSAALVGGLAFAVAGRVVLDDGTTPTAFVAGTVFGLGLLALALAGGWRTGRIRWSSLLLGVAGGVVLVVLPMVARPYPVSAIGLRPEPFAGWVAVTLIVATGEEALLRGALFDALRPRAGVAATVLATSLVFALLHVPLYGWHVVPLDIAVGFWLGGLRLASGGVAAPAIAHALADLATWWL